MEYQKTLTAHMVVKNEEKWIWYSIKSVIDYVDKFIIFDTGSSDSTVDIIKWFLENENYKDKIIFEEKGGVNRQEFVKLRHEQVVRTETDYFFVIDGDEVYYEEQMIELRKALDSNEAYDCGIMRFVCCAGDIYHYRDTRKEHYCFEGKTGAITMRVFSNHIEGISCGGEDGQWDGYYDINLKRVKPENGFKTFWGTGFYLHMSYLQRSSSIKKDAEIKWPGNRISKLRTSSTWDFAFPADFAFPKVFYDERPDMVDSPWKKQRNIIRICMQFVKNIKMRIIQK